jgi:LuxR family maltose regulon positive regulatory protein
MSISARERLAGRRASEALPRPRVRRAANLPFDVVDSKIHVPGLRSGTVSRTGLVNRLRACSAFPVVTITAPAGYGKTTLLAQWDARDSRSFAWISLDEGDDDPIVLLRHVAAAMHIFEPLQASVVDALAAPGSSIWTSALPRLADAVGAFEGLVIVVDDAHLLRSRESSEAVATLTENLSDGSVLVLAGRATPALPVAQLRTAGRLFEVGVNQLALTPREGQLLLRATGADLTLAEATELVSHCEGWPAALYLAALALREDETRTRRGENSIQLGRHDAHLADYLRTEYLSRLRPGVLRFLRRTSVLERMCGALCDAVLQDERSAGELERIERSNLFLLPLDRERVWYRYHHLFRELLQDELAEHEPQLVPNLHRRAAAWYEDNGDPESALGHARAAGDLDQVARIITNIALPAYYCGRVATVERWIAGFDDPELLERYPDVALQGSFIHALRGRTDAAERWLLIAEAARFRGKLADGSTSLQPWIATVRATIGKDGVYQMIADAESALSGLPRDSQFRPCALIALGMGYVLLGQNHRADAIFALTVAEAERLGATVPRIVAISERSLIAAARADHSASETLAAEARELAEQSHLDGYATSSMAMTEAARASLRHGSWDEARALLAKARQLRPGLTHTLLPWLTLQTLIEETRAYLALRDTGSIGSLLAEIRELVRERPYLGVLVDQAAALEREVEEVPQREDAADAGLTAAELRLLPMLATHLSFREMGEALYVSRNTVKTQAISVYRKLGVSSRSEAIARAARLGLIEPGT